ncbi:SDR family oxidoreductase [Treponema primitia]|uniref:SDR family oxidoreductase n=1 Tax=Treponema primitia TaxID=88058 RepID=UPI00025553FE|nr:SDR family oxidoreductase [Treponema primitia]
MDDNIKRFSMDYFSLKGKTAIVTGGNTNLGMSYAIAFAKAGADLFIPYFIDELSEVRQAIEAEGRRVVFLKGDLTDKQYRKTVVETCLKEYGKIDILVNNAGMGIFDNFVNYPDEAYEQVINLNLNAVYYLGHEVAKVMINQGHGKIINIGSALSYTADGDCPPYVISKHGVIGITRDFANELGKYNIQTNAICPGFFATAVNKAVQENKPLFEKISSRLPGGKWGSLDSLMGTVVFLASKASDYINGWNISVDGGFTTVL